MGDSKSFPICDEEMYKYFDSLFYKNDRRLSAKWRLEMATGEYGRTERYAAMLLGSKRLLYGAKDAQQQACLLEGFEKFLHEYVGVEGLEELFINNYGVIENHIFLEHDAQGRSKNIREHAKHQMKNAYLGSVLLLDCKYGKDMAKNISQAQSPVTRYLKNEAERILRQLHPKMTGESFESEVLKKLEEISYKSFMVSALLHDIGYPLAYYLRSAEQMTEYPPYLRILCPMVKVNFAELKSYLLDSRLFQLVDSKEIYKKYQADDHGVLSALSLLMHFYHNGRVYTLNTMQRCILEMSAIAIYRHTDRFPEGERMVYLTDPISYMVRLCDDLQEWDRFKISISGKHNYLQCGNCGRKIPENKGNYACACGQTYKKITQIPNQKVNYICLCDQLKINKKRDKTEIYLKFHLMKQLEILLEDYRAASKSQGDLKRVETMLQDQTLEPGIKLVFFVSNNPILLIQEMLKESKKSRDEVESWIEQAAEEKRGPLQAFWKDFLEKEQENPYGDQVEKNRLRYGEKTAKFVSDYFGEIYSLYEMLFPKEKEEGEV
ncbi:MAG: hypothetical protein HFI33_13375 [Lachnospiraceae bacterium]|nr:hypothetical protein [Lachnospiraceae bacterium]